LETQAIRDAWVLREGSQDHVTLDTSLKASSYAAGSFKFAVLNSDTTQSGNIGVPLPSSFGEGLTVWWSIRVRAPANMVYQPWPGSSGETAHKISIFSHSSGSNQANEVVTSVNYNRGLIGGYHQDGVQTALPPDLPSITACSNTDFKWQPAVDRGSNPLAGFDPDTGSPWSACAQDRARYGGLYSAKFLAQSKLGFGDPLTGGFRQYPDEWITITCRLIIGSWGTYSSRWTMWCAREGQPYVQLHDEQNMRLGAGPDYNTLWLLPYVTNRVPGGRKVGSRTNNITGTEILVCGLGTPIGAGTLEYVASSGLFRWKGSGESYGTAWGFSAVNGILTINVASAGTDSYLVVKVTTSSLPASGTATDTVTIADGRPDTQVNYQDVIVSTQPINAPGQFPPN
jgi:hypothetical protein